MEKYLNGGLFMPSMKKITKIIIGLSILDVLIILTNIYLMIKYQTTTKLIPIPPTII